MHVLSPIWSQIFYCESTLYTFARNIYFARQNNVFHAKIRQVWQSCLLNGCELADTVEIVLKFLKRVCRSWCLDDEKTLLFLMINKWLPSVPRGGGWG